MDAQYQGSYTRQSIGSGGGHGETEEEMQHMLQFLDASIITPPSANDSTAQQLPQQHQQQQPRPQGQQPHQQLTVEQLREIAALHETESGSMYNELGEVIDLLGSLDANDTDPALLQQHQDAAFRSVLQQQQQHMQHQRYHDTGNMNKGGNVSTGLNPTERLRTGGSTASTGGEATSQKVHLPRSTSVSSNHSGGDNISPVGLLGGPSMSPATINWLQSLVPSTSSESLTGLISPATLYSAGGGSASGGIGGVVGSAGGGAPIDGTAGKSGSIPRCVLVGLLGGHLLIYLPLIIDYGLRVPTFRTPSCEIIDWKAYNDTCGATEKTQKESAEWRVIPQHGPHADPAASVSANYAASATVDKLPPGSAAMGSSASGEASSTIPASPGVPANQSAAIGAMQMDNSVDEDGGLRTHLTRQFQTIRSTVVSLVGALSAPGSPSSEENRMAQDQQQHQQLFDASPVINAGLPGVVPANDNSIPGLSIQLKMQLAAKKMTEEKNKRKALVSPEYVQYGNPVSTIVGAASEDQGNTIKTESVQYATKVPEPTGRRPFKKSLHQTTVPAVEAILQQQLQQPGTTLTPSSSSLGDGKDDSVRCKCTGKCRNARCACVKAGLVCGVQCKCVSCANPFVPMTREGIDIQLMVRDVCLMQYLSKVKDMQELLDSTVSYECCEGGGGVVQVKHTVEHGFACPHCGAHFTYSWCNNRLCPDTKKPRRHCAKCRRCGDHRNQHCDLCNHCYFAGVANSFRCSCQSSGGGGSGVKSRAVVPNPVRREQESDSDSTKLTNRDQQNCHIFGAVNPVVEGSAGLDKNASANSSSINGAEDEADDSCKMQ